MCKLINIAEGRQVSAAPKVAVIILNWNGLQDTIECLESLRKIIYPNYQVIVLDNGSSGNDAEALRTRYKDYIHLISNDKNYGFSDGNNIGMRYALANLHPDYILLLNNDTIVDRDFLTHLVNAAEADPRIGIAGPKIYSYSEPRKITHIGTAVDWWRVGTHPVNQTDIGQFDEMREVEFVIGCALLIRRTVIERIGLLYAGYFAYFEETEWCVRCGKAGYKVIYVPTARLWHKLCSTSNKISGLTLYYMTRNRFLFMKRNASRLRLVSYLVYFSLWTLPTSTVLLVLQARGFRSLRTFYRAAYHGVTLAIRSDPNVTDSL